MSLGLGTFLVFFGLWALGAYFAWADNFATVAQMHAKGFTVGIPLSYHLACLILDALPFPILMAVWAEKYGQQWMQETRGLSLVLALAVALSIGMHLSYIEAGRKFAEFVTYGGKLTAAGRVHVLYMALGFAVVGMAYFFSKGASPALVWGTTAYLIVHVTIGVHVIYKLWPPRYFPYEGIDLGTLGPVAGASLALIGLSLWALR